MYNYRFIYLNNSCLIIVIFQVLRHFSLRYKLLRILIQILALPTLQYSVERASIWISKPILYFPSSPTLPATQDTAASLASRYGGSYTLMRLMLVNYTISIVFNYMDYNLYVCYLPDGLCSYFTSFIKVRNPQMVRFFSSSPIYSHNLQGTKLQFFLKVAPKIPKKGFQIDLFM